MICLYSYIILHSYMICFIYSTRSALSSNCTRMSFLPSNTNISIVIVLLLSLFISLYCSHNMWKSSKYFKDEIGIL